MAGDTGFMSVPGYVPLARVVRGGSLESVHYGAFVLADVDGAVVHSVGDPQARSFIRSTAKPLQIIPVLESGAADRYRLTTREIAIATASHAGQDEHVEVVSSMLGKAGLSEESLMCGTHEPGHRETALRLLREGRRPSAIRCNCSGKHAAMMMTALHLGHPHEGYTHPEHIVQTRILETISTFSGTPAGGIALAVDNCTVPTFGLTLRAAATAYARLMEPDAFSAERRLAARRIVEAMRAHPDLVGGEGVFDSDLMTRAGFDLIAKRGAEGYYGMGFRREAKGFGLALKVSDGDNDRARFAALLAILRRLGLLPADRADELESLHVPPIRNNRGEDVGRVEAAFEL